MVLLPTRMRFEEYLRFDAAQPRLVEYVAGVAYPRVDGTRRHNRININVTVTLHDAATEDGCHVYMSQMRVHVADDTVCYPDVLVACDPTDNDEWTIFRPCLIAEVSSRETVAIGHTEKLVAYKNVPSLLTYLVVSEDAPSIACHWRENPIDEWQTQLISEGVIPLPCPDVELTAEQIYRSLPPVDDV